MLTDAGGRLPANLSAPLHYTQLGRKSLQYKVNQDPFIRFENESKTMDIIAIHKIRNAEVFLQVIDDFGAMTMLLSDNDIRDIFTLTAPLSWN